MPRQQPQDVTINGTLYTVGVHPGWPDGTQAAFLVQSLIQPHILEAQEKIAAKLSAEQTEQLKSNPDDSENIMNSAMSLVDMIEIKRKMLQGLDPAEMAQLGRNLFKYTVCEDGNLSDDKVMSDHFMGNYGNFIPLMNKVIEINGFLDLDLGNIMQ